MTDGGFRDRIDAVRDRVDLVALVASAVPLSRGRNPRGKCPFHGSKSDSLAVYPETGRVRCWGCGWSGDAIKFVEDQFALSFIDALAKLEAENGLDGLEAKPVKREKRIQRPRGAEPISSAEMGRILFSESVLDWSSIATYLEARGVPSRMIELNYLLDLRFHPDAPISAWVEGGRDRVPTAPAMLAEVRCLDPQSEVYLQRVAVHATFLAPDLGGKMLRFDARGQPMPSRKFLGSCAGGGVITNGRCFQRSAPLFVAEGIETLLSGMALLEAPADAVGLALLSLDNLQGGWLGVGKRRSLPLYEPIPDPVRPPVCFAHDGMVVGLIDADMRPLMRQRVIERSGGRPIERPLSSAERSQLCAVLFARCWRSAGCRRVQTVRPPMGRDFNDVTAERAGGTFRVPE